MQLTSIRRMIAAFALLVSPTAAVLADTFSFPHILEADGRLVAIAWNVTGAQPSALTGRPVGQPNAAGLGTTRMRFSLYENTQIFSYIEAAIDGTPKTPTLRISSIPKSTNPADATSVFEIDLTPVGLELPACDVDSKEPKGVDVAFKTRRTFKIGTTTDLNDSARLAAKKQKMWLASNFRISLAGRSVPTPMSLGSIKDIARSLGDVDGDGVEDFSWESSDITFAVPNSDSAFFNELFKKTLAGTDDCIVPIKIDYLDEDGVPLITVSQDVFVSSVGFEGMFQSLSQQTKTQVVCRGVNKMNVFFQR
jgi:hypothetical protein